MEKYRHQLGRRATMMVAGILLIGISVGLLRLAAFGVDPFSCMNMGISGFLGMSFGNWQLIANILLLIVVFLQPVHLLGWGPSSIWYLWGILQTLCVGWPKTRGWNLPLPCALPYCWLASS